MNLICFSLQPQYNFIPNTECQVPLPSLTCVPKNLVNSASGRKENANNQNYKYFIIIVLLQYAYLHKCPLFILLDQPDKKQNLHLNSMTIIDIKYLHLFTYSYIHI